MNKLVFACLLAAFAIILGGDLFAADAPAAAAAAPASDSFKSWLAISIGFSLAIAVAFGAISQGRAISAAVEGMARQPEAAGAIRGALIIGLALIETLVIYMLLICFFLFGKLG